MISYIEPNYSTRGCHKKAKFYRCQTETGTLDAQDGALYQFPHKLYSNKNLQRIKKNIINEFYSATLITYYDENVMGDVEKDHRDYLYA